MCGKGVGLGLFSSEVQKWPFLTIFGLILDYFLHPSDTILILLHIYDSNMVLNDCREFRSNYMDSF